MRKYLALSVFLLICTLAVAQKKMLTMEDAMINARTTLAPETLKQLQFIKGTNEYIYLRKIDGTEMWMRGGWSTHETPYLTLTQVNDRLRAASLDTISSMPAIQFNKDKWTISLKGQKYSFNSGDTGYNVLINKNLASMKNIEDSKDGFISYVDNYNLFVAKNGNTKQVTTDGSKDIVYASSVHREEFGITKGTFWSNNGKLLAFYRMDQSMVEEYPILDWTTRPAKAETIRYPMAGNTSHEVKVAVYNTLTNNVTWIKTSGSTDQYLTNIAWSPDDKYIFIAVLNRGQDHMWLNQYDATTGDFIRTLFEEMDSKYVEPMVPIVFVKNKPDQFIWQSKRDGWNHIYLYDLNGKLLKQVTAGLWEVVEVKGFDEKGANLFYVSTEASPISRNLYSLNLKTGKKNRITEGEMVHNTSFSSDGAFVLDNYSSTSISRAIQLIDTKTGKKKSLLQSPNPLANYETGQLNIFTIKNSEGTDLYCRMYKPVGFDSTKKYPVIIYWYGGPQNQMVTNSWNGGSGDYWFQYLAERGFIAFNLDVRGSAKRGKAFEQSMFRKIGDVQMADLLSGVQYLQSLPYVDKSNMGLFGWSFGGFLTTDFMLNHPGIFKAAVAGGPVMDWKLYEIMYTERYMDTPQENPDGYEATNLIKQAGKLKDKLLLIHGLQDPVVVHQNSVNFVRAAIDKNVQVDYMIYPGHEHNVLGKDRAHLYQKVTDYFFLHLKK